MRTLWMMWMLGTMLLSGCRKPAVYEVHGVVKEFYGDAVEEGVEIEVAYAQIGFGSVSGGYTVLTSAETDANGEYHLSFDYIATSTFRVRARKDGFYMGEAIVNADDWSTEDENSLDLALYKAASLLIQVRNPQYEQGKIVLHFEQHSEGCESCCRFTDSYLFEGLIDTVFYCNVFGNQRITYTITKVWPGNAIMDEVVLDVDQGEYPISILF
jgi:hypothetical protein